MQIDDVDLASSAVLLDVDGTLLDIAASPLEVSVPPRLVESLARVATITGGALAFVSGRPIAEIDRLFKPLVIAAIGGHGAEIRLPGGPLQLRARTPIDEELRARLRAIAARHKGVLLEDKGHSLALHYRNAPQLGPQVVAEATAACAGHGSLELLSGKAVVEVKSPDFNKGTAVRELMALAPFAGRRPVFIGDDITDEAAFAVLPDFNGLGFSVGRRMPGLAGTLDEPAAVRRWLYRTQEKTDLRRAQSTQN